MDRGDKRTARPYAEREDKLTAGPYTERGEKCAEEAYRTYRSVQHRYGSLYRYRLQRYPCRTELSEVSDTGIDVVPNLPKCPVPVLMSYRTYRSVRYRYGSL